MNSKAPAKQKPWTVRRLIKHLEQLPARAKVHVADRPFFSRPGVPNDEVGIAMLEDVVLTTSGRDGSGAFLHGYRHTVELHPADPFPV